MKLYNLPDGLNAARLMVLSDNEMLARFGGIYCGPCCYEHANAKKLYKILLLNLGPVLQIHYDKYLEPMSLEFRAQQGHLLAALHYRAKENKFALLVAPIPDLHKIHLQERTWE